MKRKLKKLEQILAKNPGYKANMESFFFDGKYHDLGFNMIHFFGNEIEMDSPSIKKFTWDESWFEKPVKKKLYAYSQDDDVVFYKREKDIVPFGFKREPDFDIEYGDE